MNEVTSATTTQTSERPFAPRLILRNARSTPNLRRSNDEPLPPPLPARSRIGLAWRRLTQGFNLFVHRLRHISDEIFLSDEVVREFFGDSDTDDSADGLMLPHVAAAAATTPEEDFLRQYRQTKSLDKMCRTQSGAAASDQSVPLREMLAGSMGRAGGADTAVGFHDLDVCQLRYELESDLLGAPGSAALEALAVLLAPTAATTALAAPPLELNIGEALWEYRRSKWLATSKLPQQIAARVAATLLAALSTELHVRIYNNLVDKGKPLRNGKRINLLDLVVVINAGWVADEKWERAAKGLP